jgi:hypothetical protein
MSSHVWSMVNLSMSLIEQVNSLDYSKTVLEAIQKLL